MCSIWCIIYAVMQTKYMTIKRAAVGILTVGVLSIISTQIARAYVASDFINVDSGRAAAHPGNSNIELGHFVGPNPDVDSIVVDGAGEAVAAGNPLSTFAESNLYIPTVGVESAGYDATYPIVDSANMNLDTADTVLVAGTAALNSFGSSEVAGVSGFLDLDGNSDRDSGEDIVKAVIRGDASSLVNGTTISLFPQANAIDELSFFYLAPNSDKRINPSNPPAIFNYTNNVNEMGPTVEIVRGGDVQFTRFDSADGYCLDNAANNGIVNPNADILWWDAAGNCATFNTGIDIVMMNQGGSAFSGNMYKMADVALPEMFGSLTMGYSDANGDGQYTCSRGGGCELTLILGGSTSYPTGTQLTTGQTTMIFFGEKDDLVDGVYAVSDYPTELPAVSTTNVVLLGHELLAGENKYAYVDTNENSLFDDGEDILELITPGGAGVVNNGQAFKYFPAATKYIDSASPSYSESYDDGEAIIGSVDGNLDLGVLDGSGTDTVLVSGTIGYFTAMPAATKYYDNDSSGSFEVGDDIVNDADLSAYYNAADLETMVFDAATLDFPVEDQDISVINIYRMVGESCAGNGVDIALSGTEDSPYFGRTYSIYDDPFTTPQTYCIYADLSSSARGGRYLQLTIPQDGLGFAGGMTAPTDAGLDFSGFGHYMTITKYIDASLTPGSTVKSATTSYATTFTTTASLVSGDLVYFLFPSGYDVTGASIVCTDDGAPSAGSSSINGQIVVRTLSAAVGAGSVVECTASGVKNPNSVGNYSSFQVVTFRQTDLTIVAVDGDSTFSAVSITAPASTGRKTGGVSTSGLTITSPASHDSISRPTMITWDTSGQSVSFANITYTANGITQSIAHNVNNTGSYEWNVPVSLAGKDIEVTVELTDLATIVVSDSVALTVANSITEQPTEPVGNSACNGYSWSVPDLSDRLVKSPNSPTVYYLAPDNMLRPFFNEPLFTSWHLKFSDVRTISMDKLSQYTLGSPMAPLPGSALVKSTLDNKVYALEPNDLNPARPYLHWIANEEVAKAYFGSTWASKIIDVVPSIIVMSPRGGDLTDPSIAPCYISLY